MTRRVLFAACGFASLLSVALTLVGCRRAAVSIDSSPPSRAQRIDEALRKGARFLLARQSADGAWRSDTYGAFKDGTALTPHAIRSLQDVPSAPEVEAAHGRGVGYLVSLLKDSDDPDLSYPLYTATNAIVVLSHPGQEQHRAVRDAWVKYLRQRQLTEDIGWQPADKEYGGWGYCIVVPRKPKPGQFAPALIESNLSATLFALDALRASGATTDDPAVQKALVFVQRSQNFSSADATFDDGGFFFIYDDPVRNKAGVAGKDASGRQRYHSYGSMTADGLRALVLCGLPEQHERVRAARDWLGSHFDAKRHPGTFTPISEGRREATYFYYCASLAQAWRTVGEIGKESPKEWLGKLADELIARQQADGSWVNPVDTVRENDEVMATGFAMIALGACHPALTGFQER